MDFSFFFSLATFQVLTQEPQKFLLESSDCKKNLNVIFSLVTRNHIKSRIRVKDFVFLSHLIFFWYLSEKSLASFKISRKILTNEILINLIVYCLLFYILKIIVKTEASEPKWVKWAPIKFNTGLTHLGSEVSE